MRISPGGRDFCARLATRAESSETRAMRYSGLIKGVFCKRDNRFRATVSIDGLDTWAHVPNSGRLGELFTPGRPVWLMPAGSPNRKTSHDLKLVEFESVLVSVDARLPNPLFAEAVAEKTITGFDYETVRPEVTRGNSRLDFRLSGSKGVCWVETKSVTLVRGGTALFPDAPTERGRKHLEELMDIAAGGELAAVVFVVQRPDALRFSVNRAEDPEFANTLQRAAENGVSVRAFNCGVTLEEIFIADEIPVNSKAERR
jgi:sugar fermentation stimulation protein A